MTICTHTVLNDADGRIIYAQAEAGGSSPPARTYQFFSRRWSENAYIRDESRLTMIRDYGAGRTLVIRWLDPRGEQS